MNKWLNGIIKNFCHDDWKNRKKRQENRCPLNRFYKQLNENCYLHVFFWWHTGDVTRNLAGNWYRQIRQLAASSLVPHFIFEKPVSILLIFIFLWSLYKNCTSYSNIFVSNNCHRFSTWRLTQLLLDSDTSSNFTDSVHRRFLMKFLF